MLCRQINAQKTFLLSESLALIWQKSFFLVPQCHQIAIHLTKIRLPFSDLASTFNVESVRPKSTRSTKNLSPIFLRDETKKRYSLWKNYTHA